MNSEHNIHDGDEHVVPDVELVVPADRPAEAHDGMEGEDLEDLEREDAAEGDDAEL
jgi:hypothetical protein